MFKGLKSKLGDEAKWLQATVSHYSENLAQQVKSSAVGNLVDKDYDFLLCTTLMHTFTE